MSQLQSVSTKVDENENCVDKDPVLTDQMEVEETKENGSAVRRSCPESSDDEPLAKRHRTTSDNGNVETSKPAWPQQKVRPSTLNHSTLTTIEETNGEDESLNGNMDVDEGHYVMMDEDGYVTMDFNNVITDDAHDVHDVSDRSGWLG